MADKMTERWLWWPCKVHVWIPVKEVGSGLYESISGVEPSLKYGSGPEQAEEATGGWLPLAEIEKLSVVHPSSLTPGTRFIALAQRQSRHAPILSRCRGRAQHDPPRRRYGSLTAAKLAAFVQPRSDLCQSTHLWCTRHRTAQAIGVSDSEWLVGPCANRFTSMIMRNRARGAWETSLWRSIRTASCLFTTNQRGCGPLSHARLHAPCCMPAAFLHLSLVPRSCM